MFTNLKQRFQEIFKQLKGHGRLTEQNIQESLREVRRALLEADVNFKVARDFIQQVETEALGTRVMKSLTPGHQIVKIVHEKLKILLGDNPYNIDLPANRINKFLLVGLQGSGKTTTCAKLATRFRNSNINPLLVSCDIYRPAAAHQLEILARQLDLPCFHDPVGKNPVKIAREALKIAEKNRNNLVIFDTAGRLHIDEKMMQEVLDLKKEIAPDQIFLVGDAMTGQDAVKVAAAFNERINITGAILTKMDSDARGGAALSIKAVTGKPLVFIGTGEKIPDLELFHPERMAGRILGMGDVLSFIEKAQAAVDKEEAEKLACRLVKNQFDLTDFLKQLHQIQNMGPLENLLNLMPGIDTKTLQGIKVEDRDIKHIEAIIYAMTAAERVNPGMINGSRRQRIARGSGTSLQQVNRLLKQFEQMKKMMKNFNNSDLKKISGFPFGKKYA